MVTPARARALEPAPTRYWILHVVRAVILAAVGLFITFSRDHSPHLGLIAFGAFALVSGIVIGTLSVRLVDDAPTRRLVIAQAVVSIAAGTIALALQTTGLGTLLLTVSIWAGLTGVLELYAGYRLARRSTLSRDFLIAGGLTALLAIVFVLLPPDFQQTDGGMDNVPLTLTSSVIAVGVFGAYAAVMAVFLAIGGLSIKWQKADDEASTEEPA
ncbi:hypothetical protein [Paramicrobacterium agarici]|uniref:hypothetical protein n=1 Tax=Paramicrobacterium agarici TaxID=630514 RepID=UPI0011544FDF|nr:hypothetical protein [Microbacterium agarici]TQO23220.1 uncharacterized membrane protein HdeD (DUF308 family) [Microbacterium agarici]